MVRRTPGSPASKVKVFVGTSLDGFIARKDGAIDWLVGEGSDSGEEYGFPEFLASVDAIVMGRNTFDLVLKFPGWAYGKKPLFVLTHRPLRLPRRFVGRVKATRGSPPDVVIRLAEQGLRRLYVDGGDVIRQFLAEGLVDEITVSRLPILIGEGIPLFGPVPRDVRLRHVRTRTIGPMVQSRYEVEKREGRPNMSTARKVLRGSPPS